MKDNGTMPIAIQCKCHPGTHGIIWVALSVDMSRMREAGYEFPRVQIAENEFGARVVGPLLQAIVHQEGR